MMSWRRWLNIFVLTAAEIFGTAKHEPFGSPVDDENETRLFQKPWDSPVSSRILRDSLGTVPVFEIFEADRGLIEFTPPKVCSPAMRNGTTAPRPPANANRSKTEKSQKNSI
jgi:hypothetical protein